MSPMSPYPEYDFFNKGTFSMNVIVGNFNLVRKTLTVHLKFRIYSVSEIHPTDKHMSKCLR